MLVPDILGLPLQQTRANLTSGQRTIAAGQPLGDKVARAQQ